MIMQELKQGTKAMHDNIEALAYSPKIMGGTITLYEYKDIILKNYYLHLIVESLLDQCLTPRVKEELAFGERKKLGFLYQDLEELGLIGYADKIEEIELPHFEINSTAEALGAMYVLEGATLGGAIIKRELMKNDHIQPYSSMNYYTCYGTEIGRFWKAFVGYMCRSITHKADIDAAVAKAQETFALFEHILSQNAFLSAKNRNISLDLESISTHLKSA